MSFAFAKLCWLSLRSGVSCVEKNPQAQNGLNSLLQKSSLRANHPEQVSTRPDSLQWYLLSSPPLLLAITWLGLASNLRWKCVKERVSENWIAEGTKRKKSRLPLVYVHLSAEIRRRSRCWHSARLVRAQRTGGRYGGRSCSFLFLFVCTRPFCLPIAGVISRSEECGGHGYPPAVSPWKGALFLFRSTFLFSIRH